MVTRADASGVTETFGVRTVGVEEEYMLVTPDGAPAAKSPVVLRLAAGQRVDDDAAGGEVEKELKQEQVEISTQPCTDLAELRHEIGAARNRVGALAQQAGVRIAALGTVPQRVESTVNPNEERYRRMAEQFALVAREQLTCGCHVHVSVADDDEGVVVLDHLMRWTSVLLALSANSPYWQGGSSGYASYRSQVWGRWPTAGPTAPFGDGASYRATLDALVATGVILDDGMIYFDARLSRQYPTVEVRVADVCLDAGDAVLQAALVRALADTAVRSPHDPEPPRLELLRAAGWQAGRTGLDAELVSPLDWRPAPALDVVGQLVEHVRDALVANGDLALVENQLAELARRGTGSAEQERWRAAGGDDAAVVLRAVERTQGRSA